jgi:two-component system phosphate regulon sensor histidine kinase PhoR
MRHRRLIWQLYPSQLLITLAALLAVTWYTTTSIRTFHLEQTARGLEARALLLRGKVFELLAGGAITDLRSFCREAGKNSATRITVVAPNGLVLADSEGIPEQMENHAGRPEVAAALQGRTASGIRFSHTSGATLIYVAIPLVSRGEIEGVLRTAIPLTAIDSTLAAMHWKIAWSALAVALAVALFAWLISRRISRPLEKMRQGAARFAHGDFSARIREEGAEELAGLARSMNAMAGQLGNRLKTISSQHNQLQAVFSSMVEGVLTVNREGNIIDMNQAGARLLELDPVQARGKHMLLTIRNSRLQELIRQALVSVEPIEGEFTLSDWRGREKFFHAHGARLQDGMGEGAGALLVINDITGLRRLESVRRDFVANVSHELKTPITSIEGFAETLLDGAMEEPEEARRFLAIILQQARRLHAIVEDLLTLSRIEQEGAQQMVALQEMPIVGTLQTAIQVCSRRAEAKAMQVTLHCPATIRARINPPLLEQALVNLVDNAVKYSPEGSRIEVVAEQDAGETRIRVRDQGMGIAAQNLSRIFERFYRVDKARSARLGGTGLGLAIVKHIVQAQQGRVSVESSPDRGSTFTLHLPASKQSADS